MSDPKARGFEGPSWADVDQYAEEVRKRDGVGTRFHLAPPIARIDGRGRTSWTVTCEVWTLRSKAEKRWTAASSWGQQGSWKTAPAAFLAALRAYEAQREDERVAAEAQRTLFD